MKQRTRLIGLAAVAAMLSACGAAHATDASQPAVRTPATTASGTQNVSGPLPAARMICGPEIRHGVATLLALPIRPRASATWGNGVYTCTYRLAQGPLTLSVRQTGGPAAAKDYFASLRTKLGATRALRGAEGLGLPAYETTSGNVVFLKDDSILHVDATQLPPHVGPAHRARADLAYTLATDVIGCWSED